MRRRLLTLAILPLAVASLPATVRATTPDDDPKVVVIAGPVGSATPRFAAEAREAASIARRFTPDVVELITPHATWPAVRAALQGASLIVYLGHGNGWPSRYRDALYPPTQNGFGLDPRTGADGTRHVYVGEGPIGREVRLAPNAVVLLHHLCYASGLSEPGLPEGDLDTARQRVDNFAAGFIRAGARTVIAEAYASPARWVREVLDGSQPIETAWRAAAGANGHAIEFDSARSPGFVGTLDPETPTSGFGRSIVTRPDAARLVLDIGAPDIPGIPVAGSMVRVVVPFTTDDEGPPLPDLVATVRWTRIEPATTDLASPEASGDPDTVPVTVADGLLWSDVAVPDEPGRYRLEIGLEAAYGGATIQGVIPGLLVRVTADVDASVSTVATLELGFGQVGSIDVSVANVGRATWGSAPIAGEPPPVPQPPPALVAGWVAVSAMAARLPSPAMTDLPGAFEPGDQATIPLRVTAPNEPGDYLLVLDVVVPDLGSIVALGAEPTIVRVHVIAEAPPAIPARRP